MVSIPLSALLFAFMPLAKLKDIVDTRDGQTFVGQITEEDTAAVFIRIEGGSVIRVRRADVVRIRHDQELASQEKGYRRHDGFYFSMGMGPAFGNLNLKRTGPLGSGTITASGLGMDIDMKFGWTVMDNLILSFDVTSTTFIDPSVRLDDGSEIAPDSMLAIGGMIPGLGATYYFMPRNYFVSGSVGFGRAEISNVFTDSGYFSDDYGLSFRLKAGKEWWVSKNWGLGVSGGYAHTDVKEKIGPPLPAGLKGRFSQDEIFVLFNTTFN
jgi:hypothetical protein